MYKHTHNQKGFTLIELLIVIAVIAILAAAVFVSLNPLKRFQESRDSQRWSDVTNLVAAIKTDQVDNGGSYLAAVTALTNDLYYVIGTNGSGCNSGCTAQTTQAACVDLTALATDGYLGGIPFDPSSGSAAFSDYYLSKKANGVITVGACDPEVAATITVSR